MLIFIRLFSGTKLPTWLWRVDRYLF